MNGVWIENNRLFVKEACFGQKEGLRNRKPPTIPVPSTRGKGVLVDQGPIEIRQKFFGMGPSYAQALCGESSKDGGEHSINLFVKPRGIGWQDRSVVATMSRVVTLSTLQVSFSMNTNKVAQFCSMGGTIVLITFQGVEVRNEMINEPWMKQWFNYVKSWKGELASLERFVWLSCKGIQLSAWCVYTFQRIAECWGTFIMVDD